jgi:hypothetical protein
MTKCAISSADFSACEWRSSSIESVFQVTRFSSMKFEEVKLNAILENTNMMRCDFNKIYASIKGISEITHGSFRDSTIECSGDVRILLNEVTLKNCIVLANDRPASRVSAEYFLELQLTKCTVNNTFIFDVWLNDDRSLENVKAASKRDLRGLANVRLSYADRKRYEVPDSGRFEIIGSGLLLLFHGVRRMASDLLTTAVNTAISRQKLALPDAQAEGDVWQRYLSRLKRRDFALRELL